MIPSLVRGEDLMWASSAALLNLNLASTAGPSVAGFLVEMLSPPFAIIIDAASYVVSTVSSYLIREPGPGAGARAVRGPAVGRAPGDLRPPGARTADDLGGGRGHPGAIKCR